MRTNASGRQTHIRIPLLRCLHWLHTMSKRESLNKLNVNSLRKLATDHGINVNKKKKEDLVQEILIRQTSAYVLTPIVQQDSAEGSFQDSLPPFTAVIYDRPDPISLPSITFSDIYNFIIERPTPYGGTAKNFKGLDKSVKHFEAGDVQDIRVSQVGSYSLEKGLSPLTLNNYIFVTLIYKKKTNYNPGIIHNQS